MIPSQAFLALPSVHHISDAVSYTDTIQPYLHQLRPLLYLAYDHLTDFSALKQLYVDTNPFVTGLFASLLLSPPFLLAAEINQNFSQIDRFWSIIPTLYNLHWALYAHLSGIDSSILDLRLFVSVAWSARLTFNYWRRGGYQRGSEDYRWLIIKNYIGQPWFFILDVVFIALVQNVLLFLVTAPSYLSLLVSRYHTYNHSQALGTADYAFATAILIFIALTAIADQQQWNYQNAKHSYQRTARVPADCGFSAQQLDLGFRTTGLFAYSRHPNFVAEQVVWWTFYLWTSWNAGSLVNWTILGPVIYSLIFQGSTPITEYITSRKYPEYKEYQKQVWCFFPLGPARAPVFKQGRSPVKKRISGVNGGVDASAREKNEADYRQAKKRYDLR